MWEVSNNKKNNKIFIITVVIKKNLFSCNTTIIDTTGEGNTQKNVKNFFQNNNTCGGNSLNKTAVFVTVGVVLSLSLAFLIIMTLRRHYIPLRPKIKKTYVVHKKVKTPLTCRPTTEQCEITIENCCNMNICDTVRLIRQI